MKPLRTRLRVEYDPDPDFSWLDQESFRGENRDDHVALSAVVELQCPVCKQWHTGDALGNIDFLIDQPYPIGTFDSRDELPEIARFIWDQLDFDEEVGP